MNPNMIALTGLALCLLSIPSEAQSTAGQSSLDQLTPNERRQRRESPEVLVVRAATPSVVYIQTGTEHKVQDWWGRVRTQEGRSSGSGVVLTTGGFLVTNYHVVKGAKNIRISFEKSIDEAVYEADLVSFVAKEDLALLKIRNPENKSFEPLPMGNSSDLMTGERVVAIGNPYGHTHTVSVGIISGLHRGIKIQDNTTGLSFNFDDLIQTDASINPGNSGGPLLNINGELIGINNAVNQAAENIGFAIPIDRVKQVLEQQLISPDQYLAWLGFEIAEDDTLAVNRVFSGSPADTAGLREGDRVIGVDDQELKGLDAYRLYRLAMRPGEWANLRVRRQGRSLQVPVQAWEKSDGLIYERLGIQVQLATVGREHLLSLSRLLPEGPADLIGLQAGDLLVAMRAQVGGLARNYQFDDRITLAAFLDNFPKGQELGLEIRRNGRLYQGTVVLD
ncbi:MAG: serine protease Do [Candidatus Paceibacteria bacterium]|jgi:serine protease Do